jgi:hypothetical protein
MPTLEEIKKQAEILARDSREGEPTIQRIFWFPDEEEIHLVELTPVVPITLDGEVRPFYFRASPLDGYTASSGVAMIRPEEFGKLKLPKGWPSWNEAVEIVPANGNGRA